MPKWKSIVAELILPKGKSWNDSKFNDEEVYVNFALMKDSLEASPQSS